MLDTSVYDTRYVCIRDENENYYNALNLIV